MTSPFTLARHSVWDAIENWPTLLTYFHQKVKLDVDETMLESFDNPSISDLPAIAITPVSVAPFWYTHAVQEYPYLISIKLWTAGWVLPVSEELLVDLGNALWNCHPAGNDVPYIKAATGYYPKHVGPITFTPVELADGEEGQGASRATMLQIFIALRIVRSPFVATPMLPPPPPSP